MAEENTADTASAWVRINSVDGFSYLVQRNVALGSGTLKGMLSTDSNFMEATNNTCSLQERGAVVEKAVEYLAYKAQYANAPQSVDIPDFTERIPPELALELLMAADFLEM
ncbi:hypothetical protein BOTBODRAFT_35215 [Botryobasidium botryosum FD-172 SS1]|uniref:Elongin-C n=1 Tax=Botryobasidium botryosum (strain FD-172 SS1) TaxID=930990 RepID=A0A067M6Y3_BOTB1|nr:hypothetical protein BOTBODRAFT_35215 [Botryobasidium botryosum FD-172 SS1]